MDERADASSEDRSGWYLLDGCVSTRNRKVAYSVLLRLLRRDAYRR
jgi:hypothetical protein